MGSWFQVLTDAADAQTKGALAELKEFIDRSKEDAQDVVKEHAARIEESLEQYTAGHISKGNFYGRITDTHALLASAALVKGDAAKKASRKMAKEMTFRILGAALAVAL